MPRLGAPPCTAALAVKSSYWWKRFARFLIRRLSAIKLKNGNLYGAERLMAIVDLCGKTIADMPEYNQQLFALFMNSDFGARLGWDITESITSYARQGLLEIEQAGEMHDWIDINVLAERVAAQCIISALEFCNGDISTEGFVAVFDYSTALLMLASTSGQTHATFKTRALQSQGHVRRQANPRLQRTPGKIGE